LAKSNYKILVAGQEGMVGSNVHSLLKKKNYNIIECKRNYLDFTCQKSVNSWFKKNRPDIVINCAGKVGGILDNSSFQVEYLYNNTLIGFNLVKAALDFDIKKFINLGSACIYPRIVKQPIKEDYLLSSYLEKTNEGYAVAKIATLKLCQYIKQKYNREFISLQPANLYGEGDNFDLKSSHVLPALIKKFHIAKLKKSTSVEVWGSGNVKREFLHVKDLSEAIYFILFKKVNSYFLNVGSNEEISIKELAFKVKEIVGFKGNVYFNKKFPDGVKRRRLDCSAIKKLGWKPKINLKNGLIDYYKYFCLTYNDS
jgi:GDP-L-fucose synthase